MSTRQSDMEDHVFEDPVFEDLYARRRRILLHPRRDDVSPPRIYRGIGPIITEDTMSPR